MRESGHRPLQRTFVGVWTVATSPYTTIALLLALLAFVLICGVLPQADPELIADSARYSVWAQPFRARWGALGERLESLGLLHVVHTRVFIILVAIGVTHSILCILCVWHTSWGIPSAGDWVAVRYRSPSDVAVARERIEEALDDAGLGRTSWMRDGEGWYLRTQGTFATRLVSSGIYAGLLILVVAALVSARLGWSSRKLDLALGEVGLLDDGTKLAVRLDQIDLFADDQGKLERFNSHLTMIQGLEDVDHLLLSPKSRAAYDGMAVYQLGYGPAVRVRAWDVTGRQMAVHELSSERSLRVSRIRLSGWQQEHLLTVPETGLVLRLVHYPGNARRRDDERRLHVQVVRGRDQKVIDQQFLSESGTLTAAGLQLDIDFEYYVTIRAEREPELPIAIVGGCCVLAGAIGALFVPRRDLWLSLVPHAQGAIIEYMVPQRYADASWLARLNEALEEALNA